MDKGQHEATFGDFGLTDKATGDATVGGGDDGTVAELATINGKGSPRTTGSNSACLPKPLEMSCAAGMEQRRGRGEFLLNLLLAIPVMGAILTVLEKVWGPRVL